MTQGQLNTATPDQPLRRLIEDSYEARRREDVDAVLSYFDPEAKFRIVAGPELGVLGARLQGHAELRAAFEEIFRTWDWADFPVKDIVIEGDLVIVHCGGVMRHTPSGRELEFESLDKLRMKDGKIVEFLEFFDTMTLARFAGGGEA